MGCASSSPLPAGASPPVNDERASSGDSTVAGKVRQTVTGMADALPVQNLIDGVNHAKDEALHKIHDFGESVKDKMESAVEEVEETITSAFGGAKEVAEETKEETKQAVEEIIEKSQREVDTMVEDLEEGLAPTEETRAKDFQMDTLEVRPNSQASTAKLSADQSSITSAKSAKGKQQESTITPETGVESEAIPVERQDTPLKDEGDDGKEEKKEDGETSPLTVELPEEAKEETNPESVHHTPTPMPTEEDLRALSGANEVEPPIEANATTPLESEANEVEENDKNDSAISSSSSVTPEKELGLEERQGTPAIEVA